MDAKRAKAEKYRINGMAHQILELTKLGDQMTLANLDSLVKVSTWLAQAVIDNEIVVAVDEG